VAPRGSRTCRGFPGL